MSSSAADERTAALARLRDPAFLEALTAHISERYAGVGGDFGDGFRSGLRTATFALAGALDALSPGLLPEPYSEGCGCAPGEFCAPQPPPAD